MGGIRIAPCGAGEIFADPASAELFAEYALECANPLLRPVNPQRALYEAMEAAGAAQCYGVYCPMDHPLDAERLVGFAFVLMGPLPNYGGKFATVASLFVSGNARHDGAGAKLMRRVEDEARDAGCEEIFYSAPVGSRLAKLLFLRGEYAKTNHVFTRRLR